MTKPLSKDFLAANAAIVADTMAQIAALKRAASRRNAIRKLADRGWSLARIAEKYGISRQRVHQLLHK
jgi:hypothetical protein